MATKDGTTWVQYVGPHRPDVTIAIDGVPRRVTADAPIDVPETEAKRLLLQPDNWQEAKAPARDKDKD